MHKRILLIFIFFGLITFASCGWKEMFTTDGTDGDLFYGALFNEDEGCLVGFQGIVKYWSQTSGQWRLASAPRGRTHFFFHQYAVDKADENIYVSCGSSGRVMVSTDSGEHWKRSESFFNNNNKAHCRFASFPDDGLGWVATWKTVGQTTDLGDSWIEVAVPDIQRINAISCTDTDSGYLVDESFILYRTADAGATWELLGPIFSIEEIPQENPYSDEYPVAALRADGEQLLFALSTSQQGEDKLILFESDDAGGHWDKAWETEHPLGTVFISKDLGFVSVFLPGKNAVTLFGRS